MKALKEITQWAQIKNVLFVDIFPTLPPKTPGTNNIWLRTLFIFTYDGFSI